MTYSSPRRSGVNDQSHSFTCYTHKFIHKWNWNERVYLPNLNPKAQSVAALWPVLISRSAMMV